MTVAQVRKLALALPEAEEVDHHGRPSFRVRNKIFATLWEQDKRAVLKSAPEEQDVMTTNFPEAFTLGPWSGQGWMFVELARVDKDLFEELLANAWRRVAPKKLAAQYDDGD